MQFQISNQNRIPEENAAVFDITTENTVNPSDSSNGERNRVNIAGEYFDDRSLSPEILTLSIRGDSHCSLFADEMHNSRLCVS